MRGDSFGAGHHGRGAGRFDRGGVRGRGRDSNVWKRKTMTGDSSSTKASGSGDSGFEKWDEAAKGRQVIPPRRERWGGDDDGLTASRGDAAAGGAHAAPPRQGDDKTSRAAGKSTPPRTGDPPAYAGNFVPPPGACQICHLAGHFTANCPQAVCERCKKKGHLSVICTEFIPWEYLPVMCAFQTKGQGFHFILDFNGERQARERIYNVIVTILEGSAPTKDIEHELSVYVGQGWRCSARFFAPQKYVMRMPNPREVDRALFVEFIKLKKCGVSVKFSPWSEDMDSEGLLEVAWVRIGKIPPNKRCDRTVAYVGGLVGVTLEVDMSTLNRPSSVRAKIGCRFVDQLPASAEGMLGGRFYRFTYEVEEVLVRNPIDEDTLVAVPKGDTNKPDQTPKRKHADHEKDDEHSRAPVSENPGPSSQGGKTCRLLPQENEGSFSLDSDVDSSLLIDTMAREHEESGQGEIHGTSDWLVPVNPAVLQAPVEHVTTLHEVQVMEVDGEVDPKMKISQDYVVQLPSPDCSDEMILTPPLAPEDLLRFSKRNVQGMQEHVEAKAAKLVSKKNLEARG